MDPILEGLNAAQYTAVTSPSTVLQILAPPGSGKTKTLTSRVAYLLSHHGYKPWNILCLTFTIKSAREMKERVAKLIGDGMEARLILGTFHSVCRRYLVSYGHLIGIRKGFGIADSSDTASIIKRIIKRLNLNIEPRKAQSRISCSKSRGIGHAELAQQEAKKKNVDHEEFARVFEAYEDQLEKSNLLDYDDLLLRCVDLLRQHPTCVSNVEVVLIDEFQDTNLVQFDLMRLFAAKKKSVTTVGDPDQSIYGWRSAEIKNLKRMQKQYPDTLVINLEDNYRSSGAIILAAREVIEQDESRVSRPLLPTHCPGTVPVLRRLLSAETEASWIISEIVRSIGMSGGLLAYSDFAILLRSASLSRTIESAMGKAGLPYRMVGGQRFFDRIEIKILLDYLRVVSQPENNDALVRIINVPPRGLGATTVKALLEEAEAKGRSLWTLARDAIQGHTIPKTRMSKTAEQRLSSLINIILTARRKMLETTTRFSPEELLKYIIKKLDLKAYLEKAHENDHEARWANVEELLAQASDNAITVDEESVDFGGGEELLPRIEGLEQTQGNMAEETLSKFLANVALATELQREDDLAEGETSNARIIISTIHAAKGLEWPVVFIPSAYEGSLPHSRAEDTNEERRLLYVAMTRAQALLYMSCPTRNSQRGKDRLAPVFGFKCSTYICLRGNNTLTIPILQECFQISCQQGAYVRSQHSGRYCQDSAP
jgi:DNA helicase-2/ATP-dependent DNA helicase PcrA